jgi:hypothetical protein
LKVVLIMWGERVRVFRHPKRGLTDLCAHSEPVRINIDLWGCPMLRVVINMAV